MKHTHTHTQSHHHLPITSPKPLVAHQHITSRRPPSSRSIHINSSPSNNSPSPFYSLYTSQTPEISQRQTSTHQDTNADTDNKPTKPHQTNKPPWREIDPATNAAAQG